MYHLTLDDQQARDLRVALGLYVSQLQRDAHNVALVRGPSHPVALRVIDRADRFDALLRHLESSTAPAPSVAAGSFDGAAGAAGGAE